MLGLEAVPCVFKATVGLERGDIDAAVSGASELLDLSIRNSDSGCPLGDEDFPLVWRIEVDAVGWRYGRSRERWGWRARHDGDRKVDEFGGTAACMRLGRQGHAAPPRSSVVTANPMR